MVGTSQMAATAVVLIALAISWTPTGIAMATPEELRLEERMEIMEGKTEDRLARLEVRMAQLVTSLRVDELIPKMEAVLRKLEENCPTVSDTLSSVLRAVEAASATSSRVEMGLAKLEERSGKTEKKLDSRENEVEKGLGRLEESLAKIEEGSWKTEQKMESIEEKTEEKLVRMEVKIEEGMRWLEERMTQLVTTLKVELGGRSPSTSDSPPSAFPPAESASTSPGTATTLIPPMTSAMERPLPREDALLRTIEGSPSTTSGPLPRALPAVAAASTTSSTTLSSPPPMSPEERKALGEALCKAAKEGRARDVERLLQDGADVHYRRKDWYNRTALHAAAMNGHVDAMTPLIGAGADMNARERDGWTPLHLAVGSWVGEPAVQKLIDAGADVNSQNYGGVTPLHTAAVNGRVAAAQALITAGAELNRQENNGITPLHVSASQGNKKMVKVLIAAGARKDIRNNDGKTPYDYAALSVRDLVQT